MPISSTQLAGFAGIATSRIYRMWITCHKYSADWFSCQPPIFIGNPQAYIAIYQIKNPTHSRASFSQQTLSFADLFETQAHQTHQYLMLCRHDLHLSLHAIQQDGVNQARNTQRTLSYLGTLVNCYARA